MITLIGKPGCHLCEEARAVVVAVAAETGAQWQEVSILDDPLLADEYWEQIPVIKVDDRVIAFWKITTEQLRSALA
jgi:hypothetical protein